MAHLFIVVVYDSFNRKNVKISTTYHFPDFGFFMSQDDAHYHNHQNAPDALRLTVVASGALQMEHVLDQETAELLMAGTKVSDVMIVVLTIFYTIAWYLSLSFSMHLPMAMSLSQI